MVYQRGYKPSSWAPPTQQKTSQFAPRPFADPKRERSGVVPLSVSAMPQSAAPAQRVTISEALHEDTVNDALETARAMMGSAIEGLGNGDKSLQKLWFGAVTKADRHA